MRHRYHHLAQDLVFSYTHSSMAAPILNASLLSNRPSLKPIPTTPPPKLSRLSSPDQLAIRSFKEICRQGSLHGAFKSLPLLYDQHNSLNFDPDESFAPILELCATTNCLFQGQQVHARLIKSLDVCESVFLGTKLVFMYGKCGSVESAEIVFVEMPQRTVFTWNAMLGAYVSNGQLLDALKMYRQMRVLGVPLDAYTFPSLLKACSGLKDLGMGAEIHGLAIKFGFDFSVFVANSLVSLYAKGGDLNGARRLFERMTQKYDAVSWNSMISAYSAHGQSMEALRLFREMHRAGLEANTFTYVAALQATEYCSSRKLGMEIHAAILKSHHHLDVYVGNALISVYLSCGETYEADVVFNYLIEKDIVSWNTMLTGYVQNGLYSESLLLFHDLLDAELKPDAVTVLSIAAACGRLGNILNGKEVHACAIRNGFVLDLRVGNTLIDMYAKCNCVSYMARVFDTMPIKDSISWTTVVAGYAQNMCDTKAFELFRDLQLTGINVDPMMIGSILQVCSGMDSRVREIHGYVMRRDLSDRILDNTIIDAYGECGNIDYAKRSFELIEVKDVISWTGMICAYINNGFANEALVLFHHMCESSAEPDSIALTSILSAVASLSALQKGKEIHGFLIRKGFTVEGPIACALLDMYSHCGELENACKVFTAAQNKGLVLWTSMINAYGMHGGGTAAIDLFNKMKDENLTPDHVTFLTLLYACSHSGLIEEGRRLFEDMKCVYELEPWPEHYACLVDLLGRANYLEEAQSFVQSMKTEPTAEIWCALLAACQSHSNKQLGEIAAQKLLELDSNNPGHHVLISNFFAARGQWEDADQVRLRMKGGGLRKIAGCSWIELGNKIHTFMARDKSHPEFDEISMKLAEMIEKLKKDGDYKAETKFILQNVDESKKIEMLNGHSERLAIAYGLLKTPEKAPIRIMKNLRVCGDCHTFCKLISKLYERELIVRDANRFHHFKAGVCSCGDLW